ncbi:MAG: hypothetical protein GXP32_09990 [Kiritimatiellaeota bacterium]|nr:hypothetical protein [Kiritimatiellota bacterium]
MMITSACHWNKIALIAFFLAAASLSFGTTDRSDKIIAYARAKKGRTIVCSPGGKVPGTMSYEAAYGKLSSGMILQMHPGFYNTKNLVIFRKDNLIIEGIGPGYVNTPIIMYGKNCIVRNLKARGISGGNVTIVDSVAHGFSILAGKAGKSIIANCAGNSLTIYPNLQDVLIKNCTFIRSYKVKNVGKASQSWTYNTYRAGRYSLVNFGQMLKRGKVKFENTILYSGENMFSRPSVFNNMTLQNNIIHCERSLIPVSEKKTPLRSLNMLKDKFTLKLKRKSHSRIKRQPKNASKETNFLVKPQFKRTPSPKNGWQLSRDNFVLLPNSPGYGQDIGVNMGSNGIPVAPPDEGKKKK